jgi:hypothetical protein
VTRLFKTLKWAEKGGWQCKNVQPGRYAERKKALHKQLMPHAYQPVLWRVSLCFCFFCEINTRAIMLYSQIKLPSPYQRLLRLLFSQLLNQLSLDYEAAANVGKQSVRLLLCLFWACSRRLKEAATVSQLLK